MDVALTEQERMDLAVGVMEILDRWKLVDEDIMRLLGIDEGTKPRHLSRLRRGTSPIVDEGEQLERSKIILGIQRSLDLMFPLNRNMSHFWMRNRNKRLKGVPMVIMLNGGVIGMDRVWRHLDCTRNWED